MHLAVPRRYSEDLDYVRASAGGIQPLTQAVTKVGESLGFEVRTQMSAQPKVYLRTTATSGEALRIKIEVNTHERTPALPLVRMTHDVRSSWFSGSANVQTFVPAELLATKIRALYQRKKGRDLFDLWLALTELKLGGDAIAAAFGPTALPG
ncbi:MAG: nucleotidyl transferase AbiEii/AbiGii toxin family protein [Dehalococcoidia bacterium]|nr:nucleotidyl transferase AbiEii/AbiGii toxin family protein [Dehalococcoidia bacterium]